MIRVGNAHDVTPGGMNAFDVAGTRVAVVSAGGEWYAFDDTCTHRACSLTRSGRLEGTTITCRCHGSQFDVTTGAVLLGPAQQPVRSREVQVQGDDLLVEE